MNSKLRTIFCDECKKDIPIEEFEDGTIVVHCPKCIGECMLCECHLAKECFPDAPEVKVHHSHGRKEGVL